MLFGTHYEQDTEPIKSSPPLQSSKRIKRNKSANSDNSSRQQNGSKSSRRKKQPNETVATTKPVKAIKLTPADRPIYDQVWEALGFQLHTKPALALFSNPKSNKPVCVTEIDGFVGSWIVFELLSRGYHVRGTIQSCMDDITGVLALPNASSHLQVVETSLLTPESCDLAVEGCDFVIHTGTPSSCSVRDPMSEMTEPGVHSVGSRMHCIIPMMTNFIQACARSNVKKVVLTSSIAAMVDSVNPNDLVTDIRWNMASSLEKNPHFLSLKLAEEAAWQLVDQLPEANQIELISINAGTLMGPVLCKGEMPAGNRVFYDLITGKYSALVDLNWAMVDIRDCARAHVVALESPNASGRYICVNKTLWLKNIVEILATNGYSGRDLPWMVGLPNWVARLPSYTHQLGQVGASLYSLDPSCERACPYLNERICTDLQLRFDSVEKTIVDTAANLLKWGLIKPWDEDHEAVACKSCNSQFTFYRRKHHCRECGVIICNYCSQSRAVVENLEGGPDVKARLCDICVKSSIPALLELINNTTILTEERLFGQKKAVIALESLLENSANHHFVNRSNGIVYLLMCLHVPDDDIKYHATGAIYNLSLNLSSSLQMVLEGVVLQLLEIQEKEKHWKSAMQTLRNIWKQINKSDFRKMLHAVARISSDAAIGALKGNILLTFVHMMEEWEIPSLLPEGLCEVLYLMLQNDQDVYPRCAAAHAIQHLIPESYAPNNSMTIPAYTVDNHEELLTNAALSDLQFLVKGSIEPINAHKVVLFFRNAYFKNMFGSATSQKSTIEIDNCSHHVFTILLRFLYTGKVSIDSSFACELLKASSHYQVFELQKRTEHFLIDEICVENVVRLLYLSDQCNATDLKKNCITFLMQNIHAVVRLDNFQEYRQYAAKEILLALVEIKGKGDWEVYCLPLFIKQGKDGLVPESETSESSLISALKSTYSPRKKKIQHADINLLQHEASKVREKATTIEALQEVEEDNGFRLVHHPPPFSASGSSIVNKKNSAAVITSSSSSILGGSHRLSDDMSEGVC